MDDTQKSYEQIAAEIAAQAESPPQKPGYPLPTNKLQQGGELDKKIQQVGEEAGISYTSSDEILDMLMEQEVDQDQLDEYTGQSGTKMNTLTRKDKMELLTSHGFFDFGLE